MIGCTIVTIEFFVKLQRRAAMRFAAGWLVVLAAGALPAAECSSFRVRDQDQVWLVSTRHLGCSFAYLPTFQVSRYAGGIWQPASEAEFFSQDSADLVTPIYVHGNRIDAGLASSYGLSVYFELAGKLPAEQPVRFVIWSWPADQVRGPINDVRSKAARSDVDAFYLGNFLARLNPAVRVGLIGYSFGARIVSGAMHLLGGGALCGSLVPSGERPSCRVALWGAAEHNHWYQPGQFHDRAPAAAAAWFVTVNYCDPVLSRYRHIEACSDPCAVGFAGIAGRNLLPPEINARFEEINVSQLVGGEHHWRLYLYSQYIQERTRNYVLWHDLGHGAASGEAAAE